MKRISVLLAAVVCVLASSLALAQGSGAPSDTRKLTSLGKYVNAMEAYILWRSKPGEAQFLDVRTPQEYAFIGHVPSAVNIPFKLWTGKYDPEKTFPLLEENKKFAKEVSARFGKNDTILVYCRNGWRSAGAVNILAEAGFTNVYSVTDGFEGDPVTEPGSVFKGKHVKNGWKNWGLPWTYALDPKLVYPGK